MHDLHSCKCALNISTSYVDICIYNLQLYFFNYHRNIKNVQKMNQKELDLGLIGKKSWHDQYKDSAWVFIGGLPYDLTEGDVIAVFSQYSFSLISAV